MHWKKILLIVVVAGAFAFAAVPRSEARVSIGIGLGFPIGFSYGYGYPYGYPYGYSYGYPYGYYGYPRPVVYIGPRYHRHHIRRVHHRYHRPWRHY